MKRFHFERIGFWVIISRHPAKDRGKNEAVTMSSIRKLVHWTTFFTVLIFALTLLLAMSDVSLNNSLNAQERRWCEQHTSCETWECCFEFIVFWGLQRMTSSNFLVYLYELGLSLLLLGLYSISGLTLTFLVLMGVGLVLGEDKCDPAEQIEIMGFAWIKLLSNRYCAFPQGHILFKVKLNSIKTKDIKRKGHYHGNQR